MKNCRLTSAKEIEACWVRGRLLIRGVGLAFTSCEDVEIQESLLDIFPPQFNLVSCRPDGAGICADVVLPKPFAGIFTFPKDAKTVSVHTSDGAREVPIGECKGELGLSGKDGDDEATGLSAKSYEDATLDAVGHLRSGKKTPPDVAQTAEVVEMGYIYNGFIANRFYVKVKRKS